MRPTVSALRADCSVALDSIGHVGEVDGRHADRFRSVQPVPCDFVQALEDQSGIVSLAALGAHADRHVSKNDEALTAAQIDGDFSETYRSATLTWIERHNLDRIDRDNPQASRIGQAANQTQRSAIGGNALQHEFAASEIVALGTHHAASIHSRLDIEYGKAVALHFLFGVASQLIVTASDFAAELPNA